MKHGAKIAKDKKFKHFHNANIQPQILNYKLKIMNIEGACTNSQNSVTAPKTHLRNFKDCIGYNYHCYKIVIQSVSALKFSDKVFYNCHLTYG